MASASEPRLGLRIWLLGLFLGLFFRILRATWRIEEDDVPEQVKAVIREGGTEVVALFHEDEWALLGVYADQEMHALVSMSEDGSIMAELLRRCGFVVVRGSSSRGAARGLIALIRSLRKTKRRRLVSMAVDGPKGPRRRAKPGVFKLAESLSSPVMAVGSWSSRAFVFSKSWSKAHVPAPFARVRIVKRLALDKDVIALAAKTGDFANLSAQLEESIRSAKYMAREEIMKR